MYLDRKICIGKAGEKKIYINPKMANRHGMIAGATGTGKTVSLKVMAESFSDCGVPVFLADVKGDLSGTCNPGVESEEMTKRINDFGLAEEGFSFHNYPVTFWDIYGEKGLPLRSTISEMGPLLLSRIMGLNDTQEDILTVIFKIADDEGLLLLDTKDLRAMLQYVSENADAYSSRYGKMSPQSLAVIIRSVIALEAEGGEMFFGEPALNINDWLAVDCNGKGNIQILDCQKLINNPTMYSTFMLWMMSELFENLPEAGDLEKPKMVFFFDEAHLLFANASKTLLEKIEQVVKLIRSKGVGIYFITQSPKDIPDGVLAQLGNKVQHALHAYTPTEQKAVKVAADSFRVNPEFKTADVLQELGIGEALVSVLDEQGVPTIVERTKIFPPESQMGPISDADRDNRIKGSLMYGKYAEMYDRESAYELLVQKVAAEQEELQRAIEEQQRLKEEEAAEKQRIKEEEAAEKQRIKEEEAAEKQRIKEEEAAEKQRQKDLAAQQKQYQKELEAIEKQRQKEAEAARKALEKQQAESAKNANRIVKSVASTTGGTVGREIGNVLGKTVGGSFGKRLGGNVGASLGRGILSTLFKK